MKEQSSEVEKTKVEYYWIVYAEHYLSLAEIGIQELVLNKHKDSLILKNMYANERKLGIIAIIFNIRHALELTKKYFLKSAGYDFKVTHELTDEIDKLEGLFLKHHSNLELSRDLSEFKWLLVKYEYNIFQYGNAFKKNEIKDSMNVLFRYPERRDGELVQVVDLVDKFPLRFIHQIRFDIITIYSVLIFFKRNEGWLSDVNKGKEIRKQKLEIEKERLLDILKSSKSKIKKTGSSKK